MNITKEGEEIYMTVKKQIYPEESSLFGEELRNCFALMRESKDAKTAEAAIQTDRVGEQHNDGRVDANR